MAVPGRSVVLSAENDASVTLAIRLIFYAFTWLLLQILLLGTVSLPAFSAMVVKVEVKVVVAKMVVCVVIKRWSTRSEQQADCLLFVAGGAGSMYALSSLA